MPTNKKNIVIKNMKGFVKYLAGRIGPSGYGSNSTAEDVTSSTPIIPLTAIVTGATSGIGAETARALVKRGIRVVIPARDLKKASGIKREIQKECPNAPHIIVLHVDLSSFASVITFCSNFLAMALPLNILINNAGKFSPKLEFSEDKFEMTFATNYLGHYLLTEMLKEKMILTAAETGIEGRIVNVSSVLHNWVKTFEFNQIINPTKYNGTMAYSQSKLANLLHAKEIARQLKARNANVSMNAVHPGIVKTAIMRDNNTILTEKSTCADCIFFMISKLLKSTAQGAATTCYVALSKQVEGVSGKYFSDCNESNCSNLANDKAQAQMLWNQTQALLHTYFSQQLPQP